MASAAPSVEAPTPAPRLRGSGAQDFRLEHVARIETELRQERAARRKAYKKYRRVIGLVDAVASAASAVTVSVGGGGIALTSTGVGGPAGVALEALAVVGGLVAAAGLVVSRRLGRRAKKHDRVAQSAEAALAAVGEIVSRGLAG